jgi:hypothetical protein
MPTEMRLGCPLGRTGPRKIRGGGQTSPFRESPTALPGLSTTPITLRAHGRGCWARHPAILGAETCFKNLPARLLRTPLALPAKTAALERLLRGRRPMGQAPGRSRGTSTRLAGAPLPGRSRLCGHRRRLHAADRRGLPQALPGHGWHSNSRPWQQQSVGLPSTTTLRIMSAARLDTWPPNGLSNSATS